MKQILSIFATIQTLFSVSTRLLIKYNYSKYVINNKNKKSEIIICLSKYDS